MKSILLITTGGTIASIQTSKGLVPGLDGNQLLEFIPKLKNMCNIEVRSVFNLDSTNVYYKHWLELVKVIKEEYDNYDGFVICHGTDTLSFTASALSYLIQNSKKPIVLTGAQRPINLDISDAKTNLLDSFTYACDDKANDFVLIFLARVPKMTLPLKIKTTPFALSSHA